MKRLTKYLVQWLKIEPHQEICMWKTGHISFQRKEKTRFSINLNSTSQKTLEYCLQSCEQKKNTFNLEFYTQLYDQSNKRIKQWFADIQDLKIPCPMKPSSESCRQICLTKREPTKKARDMGARKEETQGKTFQGDSEGRARKQAINI